MRPKTIVGLVLIVTFTSLLFMNFGRQVGGYMNFAEAEEAGTKAHVVGMWVDSGTFRYDAASNVFTFEMQDEVGNIREVRYGNPKPANFEDAEKLVIDGYAEGGHFVAENILVKCPSKYNDARGLDQVEGTPVESTSDSY
ncbi:MAG: cytochrome c maturation protein CcmE [Bacteroidetes bacterium]|nr:cytochrome c maturation protein CcmE [Bacteroidota bacterium]